MFNFLFRFCSSHENTRINHNSRLLLLPRASSTPRAYKPTTYSPLRSMVLLGSRGKLGSTTNAKSVRTIFELRAIQVQKGRHLAAPRKLSIVVCNKNAAEGAISIVEVGKTALRSAPPTTNQRARICESALRTVPSTNRRARFCGPRASGARRYRRLSAEPPQPSKSQTQSANQKKFNSRRHFSVDIEQYFSISDYKC